VLPRAVARYHRPAPIDGRWCATVTKFGAPALDVFLVVKMTSTSGFGRDFDSDLALTTSSVGLRGFFCG
jgi:hypothetical protein